MARRKRAIRVRPSWSFSRSSSSVPFVQIVPFFSSRIARARTAVRGEGRPVGPRRTATRSHVSCVPRTLVGSDDFGVPLSSKGSVQSVVALGQKSVLVSLSPSKGTRRAARGPQPHGR